MCSHNNALNKRNWTQKHVDASAFGVIGSDSHVKILLYFVFRVAITKKVSSGGEKQHSGRECGHT